MIASSDQKITWLKTYRMMTLIIASAAAAPSVEAARKSSIQVRMRSNRANPHSSRNKGAAPEDRPHGYLLLGAALPALELLDDVLADDVSVFVPDFRNDCVFERLPLL